MENNFLESALKQFRYYKLLADKAMDQLQDGQLFTQCNDRSNSIAVIIRHMSGNMISRFTDFLTDDGEKPWRDRDAEFDPSEQSRAELIAGWEKGWQRLFATLADLQAHDLEKIVYIRNQGHTVTEAVNRQLAHYPYHVGQIVYIAKMLASEWQSLSIAINGSQKFNDDMFAKEKMRSHFTDEVLSKDPENEQ